MSLVNDERLGGRWWVVIACTLACARVAQAQDAGGPIVPPPARVPVASEPAPANAPPSAAEHPAAAPQPSAAASTTPVTPPAPAAASNPAEPPVIESAVAPSEPAPHSWFWRPPLRLEVGEGRDRWSFTVFGFVEADSIFDSTRSYDDAIGGALVARSDTYAGHASRSQFSVRNSRLGLMFTRPTSAACAVRRWWRPISSAINRRPHPSARCSTARRFACDMRIYSCRATTST